MMSVRDRFNGGLNTHFNNVNKPIEAFQPKKYKFFSRESVFHYKIHFMNLLGLKVLRYYYYF